MSLIRRIQASPDTTKPVKWNSNIAGFTFSKWDGKAFTDTPVTQPFVLDIWLAQQGWEWWVGEPGSRQRQSVMASISDPFPTEPAGTKAKQICVMPVYSTELGMVRDLFVKEAADSIALDVLFNAIHADAYKAQQAGVYLVPIINVTTETPDGGSVAPVFNVVDWKPRPMLWRAGIVVFDPPKQAAASATVTPIKEQPHKVTSTEILATVKERIAAGKKAVS